MKDVKVNRDCYIPKRNIKYYISYSSNAVREDVRRLRKENKVLDYTNGKRISSVIYLTTGEVIIINTTIDTINARMNQAED